MIRLIWLFLVAVAVAAGAALLAGRQGEIVIAWSGAEYRMAPAVAAALAVMIVALLVALWRFAGWVLDWPGAMSAWRRNRRRRAGYVALARGMVAVSAGDAKEARRQQARAREHDEEPLLSQLLAAQTAQLEGDEPAAARAYADMLGRPETEFLGLRGLFMQALRRGDMIAARRHAARAFALRPQTPWVAAALFDLEAQARNWSAAEKVLEAQGRAKLLGADAVKRRRAVIAAAAARELVEAGSRDAALDKARAALKTAPGLLPAALTAAEIFIAESRPKRAASVLEAAWKNEPHPDLAATYALLNADAPTRRFDRLIALNPSHAESRLLSAAQAVAQNRWAEAETLLAQLTERHSGRACRLMADIAVARGDTDAARLWADRALRAPRDGVWHCGACGHEASGWSATCTNCGAFDTLAWTPPGAAPVAVLADDGADRVLYRLAAPAARHQGLPEAEILPPQDRERE